MASTNPSSEPNQPPHAQAPPQSRQPSTSNSTSYPSWLPRRPQPPLPPGSERSVSYGQGQGYYHPEDPTLLDPETADADESKKLEDDDGDDSGLELGENSPHPRTRTPEKAYESNSYSYGGRRPAQRSVRIVPSAPVPAPNNRHRTAPARLSLAPSAPGDTSVLSTEPRFTPALRLSLTLYPSLLTKLRFYLLPLWIFGPLLAQTYLDLGSAWILFGSVLFSSRPKIAFYPKSNNIFLVHIV